MEDELFHSGLCIDDDTHGSDLEVSGVDESSEEEADEDDVLNLETSYRMEPAAGKDGQIIESFAKRDLITSLDPVGTEPCEGMEFESEDAAWEFYQSYAQRSGFKVRISKRFQDGLLIYLRFVCCSQLGYHSDKGQTRNTQQEGAPNISCMSRLVVKKQSSGKWVATKFQGEHNHETMEPKGVDLKSHLISDAKKTQDSTAQMERPNAPQGKESLLRVGMEFSSEEAARLYYYAYARDVGFTVRISKCRRARDGSIICRRFVCSKEGYYVRKCGRTKRSRALTRVGCMARLVVKKLNSGVWVVVNFESEHNHPPFVTGHELNYQPPNPARKTDGDTHAELKGSSRLVCNGQGLIDIDQDSVIWRFNKLYEEGIKFAEEGASSLEIFNFAMFALREAKQKVVSAKKGIAAASHCGSNQGVAKNNVLLGNKTSKTPHASSDNSSSRTDPRGPVTPVQQPVNLVLITPGLQCHSTQSPVSINISNNQSLLTSTENHAVDVTVPVHQQIPSSVQATERNGSACGNIFTSRKRTQLSEDSVCERQPKDNDSPSKGCEIVSGSCANIANETARLALSDAQVAALQAVADAFNAPTTGATCSSGMPLKVSPISRELSKASSGNNTLDCNSIPKPPSAPNPLVHAAAIAAGARIVPPSVAASLIKAVQSRPAIHIRSGGFIPKLPTKTKGLLSSKLSVPAGPSVPNGPVHSDSHEICPKDPPRQDQMSTQKDRIVNNNTDASSDRETRI